MQQLYSVSKQTHQAKRNTARGHGDNRVPSLRLSLRCCVRITSYPSTGGNKERKKLQPPLRKRLCRQSWAPPFTPSTPDPRYLADQPLTGTTRPLATTQHLQTSTKLVRQYWKQGGLCHVSVLHAVYIKACISVLSLTTLLLSKPLSIHLEMEKCFTP